MDKKEIKELKRRVKQLEEFIVNNDLPIPAPPDNPPPDDEEPPPGG